jgi:polyphosphate kinase
MPRNLFERCEVVFPVRDAVAKARIEDEILPAYLVDTVKARLQQADGSYLRASKVFRDAPVFSSQDFMMQLAEGKTDLSAIPQAGTVNGAVNTGAKTTAKKSRATRAPAPKADSAKAHAAD